MKISTFEGDFDNYAMNEDACILESLETDNPCWRIHSEIYPDKNVCFKFVEFYKQVHPEWKFRIRQAVTGKIIWRSYSRSRKFLNIMNLDSAVRAVASWPDWKRIAAKSVLMYEPEEVQKREKEREQLRKERIADL